MSISGVLQAGVSGLQAASLRVEAAASNIANANTEGYRRLDVRQSTIVAAPPDRASGVRAALFGQDQGRAQGPGTFGNGVDLATELVSLVQAKLAYEANAKSIAVAADLANKSVNLSA